MIGEAYRKFLWHRVTVKRNTTAVSDTGVSTYNYATIFTDVPCNVQDAGGRFKVDDNSIQTGKKLRVIFASEWSSKLQHNDILVINGETYKITHGHDSWYNGPHHVEIDVEADPTIGTLGTAG